MTPLNNRRVLLFFRRFWLPALAIISSLGAAESATSPAAPAVNLLACFRQEDWVRVPLNKTKQLDARNPWQFDAVTGIMRCEGAGIHEMLLHRAVRRDGILRVEWRYPGTPAKANSGVFVRTAADNSAWLQGQLSLAAPGTLFGVDGRQPTAPVKLNAGMRRPEIVRGNGEWNLMEITCRGATVSLRLNGVDVAELPNAPLDGLVGLEAEMTLIEFRAMSFQPLTAGH